MSDYTPTTDEVRQLYVDATRELLARDMYLDEIQAEFDRWLAEVKAQERQAERDRIIALLEDDESMHQLWWIAYRHLEPYPTAGRLSQYELMDAVIALIKGENNE